MLDTKPRSREVFSFHQPETLLEWRQTAPTLRNALRSLPVLSTKGLRDCQINAITKLEESLSLDKPRALIQMATGAGKTFTAITEVYRLLKFAGVRRVLFLVDIRNLGEQAEQEFMAFVPNDDNRKFTELYNVQRLKSSHIARDSQVLSALSSACTRFSKVKNCPKTHRTHTRPSRLQGVASHCRWCTATNYRRNFSMW